MYGRPAALRTVQLLPETFSTMKQKILPMLVFYHLICRLLRVWKIVSLGRGIFKSKDSNN